MRLTTFVILTTLVGLGHCEEMSIEFADESAGEDEDAAWLMP